MRKIIHIVLVGTIGSLILISSCGKKDNITPIDPVLENFKNSLVGKWNVVITAINYPVSNGEAYMAITNVTCTTELQWDYVKTLTIESNTSETNVLRVTNEYYCALQRTTFFELIRQKNIVPNNTFLIIEKDESGNMMKIYKVDGPTSPTQFILSSRIFDISYFYPAKVGSIPTPPVRYGDPNGYTIGITKQ